MDDENASCTHNGEDDAHLSLLDLPVEIFLHICSFLDASTLVHGLSLVCKQFYLNLNDDILWKARINRIWSDASHPLLRPARPDKLFWMSSCVAFEKQTMLWQQQNSMQKVTINIPNRKHYRQAPVLLRHINGITYIIGVTDDTLHCCTLSFHEELPSYEVRNYAKEAFGYCPTDCLTAIDHTIYGCLKFNTVKSWVLINTGLVHQETYKPTDRGNPHMRCIASCPEQALFATGSIDGTIYVFDSRASNKPIMHYRPHNDYYYVSNLAMDTEYILSARTDTTMAIWDQRAGRVMKSIRLTSIPSCNIGILSCMSMGRDWVCVGGTGRNVHVLDRKNDFELVKSYSTEHTSIITGVRLTHGCLITSSRDGTVRISSPTDPPKPIATLHSKLFELTSMDYLNDTLATSDSEGNIVVWRPK